MPLSEDAQRKLDQIEQALAKGTTPVRRDREHRSVATPSDRVGRRRVHHRDRGPRRCPVRMVILLYGPLEPWFDKHGGQAMSNS